MSAFKEIYCLQSIAYRFLFLIFIATATFFIFPSAAFAAAGCIGVGEAQWCPLNTKNYQDEIATQRFGRNILVFGHVALFGTNPLSGETYSEQVAYKEENGKTVAYSIPGVGPGNINDGALAMATHAIASLYSPPTSSTKYLANLGQDLGILPKPVYAAPSVFGSGYNVILPVYKLWEATRNIAFYAYILVFIAAGFMIMFRQKLNPQTIIGIQQALPGLIIGIILIYFSYFIASVIVDFSFVGTRLVAEIFIMTNTVNYYGCKDDVLCINPNLTENQRGILDTYQNSDAFKMYGRAGTRVSNVTDVFGEVYGTLSPKGNPFDQKDVSWLDKLKNAINAFRIGPESMVMGPAGVVIGAFSKLINYNIEQVAAAGLISTLAAILIPLILGIALMIQFIRLIIALLMSYLQILLMVIFSPFLILFSAVPGRGGTLGYWLKSLFANVLVFPAVFAGFLFAGMLLQWDSGILDKAAMPLFGGLKPDILKSLLAFGVLLGLPSVPEMVRGTFGVKGPQGFTQAAIGGFMGGFNTGRGAAMGGYNQAMERTGIRQEQQARQKQMIDSNAAQWNAQGQRVAGGTPGLIGRIRDRAIRGWFS